MIKKTGPRKEVHELAQARPKDHPLAMAGPSYLSAPPPVRAAGDGTGYPWIGHATRKTGSSGGKVTWQDLQEIGVKSEGEPYLCIGEDYFPMANVPVALLEVVLVQQERDASFRVKAERRVSALPDADDGYRYVLAAALLIPENAEERRPACVATYQEDLHPAVGYNSRCLERLRQEVQKTTSEHFIEAHPNVSKLPPALRVIGELVGTVSTSKAGNSFVKRSVNTRLPKIEELGLFVEAASECEAEILQASEYLKNIGGGGVVDATTNEEPPF